MGNHRWAGGVPGDCGGRVPNAGPRVRVQRAVRPPAEGLLLDHDHAGLRHLVRRRLSGGGDLQDVRSEEHTSELQSHSDLVCRLLLEKKKKELKYHSFDDTFKLL